MNEWELIKVDETEWQQDKSGIFTYISYCPDGTVRLDVMADTGLKPVISFQGKAGDVRKVAVRWLGFHTVRFSVEHASYIGSELSRAELLETEYIQS
ncbi:hypothetical protein LCGC14_1000350 [marine sediment metagenome]|uniref:Uncharacterized protein n=1 Tax=marine sediment metagenome TaxID=412755 RepID=A0A0F9N814_9ZZZZ